MREVADLPGTFTSATFGLATVEAPPGCVYEAARTVVDLMRFGRGDRPMTLLAPARGEQAGEQDRGKETEGPTLFPSLFSSGLVL
jgi:hypothetical protein